MRKAVLIGIDDYPGCPLNGCINDAKALSEVLKYNEDGSRNFDVRCYTDIEHKGKLLETIHELFRDDAETVLFYFAGHGSRNEIDTYLVTPDAEKFNLGVSLSDLLSIANKSNCRNKIIVLDCCHSGSMGNTNILGDTRSLIEKGITILTSSRPDQHAMESDGHGIFTNLLLQALEGGAADINGNITPAGVYAYIDQALGAFGQRPLFKTNTSEFAPIRKIKPQVAIDVLKRMPLYFHDATSELPLNPSFEESNIEGYEHKIIQPFGKRENIAIFKDLQKYQSIGLLSPVDETYMYHAAMNSKSCKLTRLGQHYWRLAKEEKLK